MLSVAIWLLSECFPFFSAHNRIFKTAKKTKNRLLLNDTHAKWSKPYRMLNPWVEIIFKSPIPSWRRLSVVAAFN